MSIRAICLGALAAAAGGAVLLAGCSDRSDSLSGRQGQGRAAAAQRIVLDPVTHLATSAPQADALAAAPDSSASAVSGRRSLPTVPEEVRLPDGTVGVKVAQQYFHTIVVCRQRDGSFSPQCPAVAAGAGPAPAAAGAGL
ncbi:MAG TPA: hypothetical protein VF931_01115 [Steroidobacteraceae bacterium]